jgi:polyisoprenoid-binding protein YceI
MHAILCTPKNQPKESLLMKSFALLVVALFVTGIAAAQPTVWKVDPVHSNITFAVDYMVLTEVTGNFRDFSATMVSDSVNPGKSSVNVVIKTASITTENDRRDSHLRSAEFFDATTFPEITFVSKSFEKGEGNAYKIAGDLTMRGVTKPVTIDAKYMGQMKDTRGKMRQGFKGITTLNRNDFGLNYNSTLESGGLLIGNNVTVTINAQFVQQ